MSNIYPSFFDENSVKILENKCAEIDRKVRHIDPGRMAPVGLEPASSEAAELLKTEYSVMLTRKLGKAHNTDK